MKKAALSSFILTLIFTLLLSFSLQARMVGPNDADGDGDADGVDNCINTYNPTQANKDHDGLGDACDDDDDGDGDLDANDNCPLNANSDQANHDGDAQGDACDTDDDNDGDLDTNDNCDFTSNPDQANHDGDTQGDACDTDDDNDGDLDTNDNCDFTSNPDQANHDGDTQGDACDTDDDNDGDLDTNDNCPLISNPDQADADSDGSGDACDTTNDSDRDGDLYGDSYDNCPDVSNETQTDTDHDGQGNACDADDDNDGILDGEDSRPLVADTEPAPGENTGNTNTGNTNTGNTNTGNTNTGNTNTGNTNTGNTNTGNTNTGTGGERNSSGTKSVFTACSSDNIKAGCLDVHFANGQGYISESFNLPNPKLFGKKIFVDASGDINVGGLAFQNGTPVGFYAAYDSSGNIKTSYSGTIGGTTLTLTAVPFPGLNIGDILIDGQNKVFVGGIGPRMDFPLGVGAKQASKKEDYQNMQLISLEGSPIGADNGIISLATDSEGRILALGKSKFTENDGDMITIYQQAFLLRYIKDTETSKWKLDNDFNGADAPSGHLVMAGENLGEYPKKVLVDSQGNVYVIGYLVNFNDGENDAQFSYSAYIIKFNPANGTQTSQRKLVGIIDDQKAYDEFLLMEKLGNLDAEIDSNGQIVIVGMKNVKNANGTPDALFIHRYDSNLNSVSQEIPLAKPFSLSGIVLDEKNAIIAAGFDIALRTPDADPTKILSYKTNSVVMKLGFSLDTQTYDYDPSFGTSGRQSLDYTKAAGLFDVGLSEGQIVVVGGAINDDDTPAKVNANLIVARLLNQVCGNGSVEGTEECDDGNTANGDTCSSSCTPDSGSDDGNETGAGTESGNAKLNMGGGGCSLNAETSLSLTGFTLSSLMMLLGLGLMRLAVQKRN